MTDFTSLAQEIRDALSVQVLVPFTRLQRLARPSTRAATKSFFEGMEFRSRSAHWTQDEKTEWIRRRLQATVRYAYEETVYYRTLLDSIGFDPNMDFGFHEFSRLPILEREDVQNAGRTLFAKSVPATQSRKDATGGSTGAPTEVLLGPQERGWIESGMEYFRRVLGVREGSRTAFFWGHHLDPQASDTIRERLQSFVWNTRWFDCMRLSPDVLDQVHLKLQRWRPACIVAYAGALGQLAEHIVSKSYEPSYPSQFCITGAEKLWPWHREIIEKAFGCPVYERYGSRDTGLPGMQLDPAVTLDYTLDWANFLVEPESIESESSILITKLHADAMPMIRYRVGDIGRFADGSKPGHPAFKLHEIVGRVVDRIWLPDGRWISGVQIPHLLKDYPVREFLFLQRKDYSIELQIVPLSRYDQKCNERILNTVKANLPGLNVEIRITDSVARTRANKWRPVISEVVHL